jgi:hypothetical protein
MDENIGSHGPSDPEGKIPKDMAAFRQSEGPENCGNCANFDGQSLCSVVEGPITPNSVSDLFQPKKEDNPDRAALDAALFGPGPGAPAGPAQIPGMMPGMPGMPGR